MQENDSRALGHARGARICRESAQEDMCDVNYGKNERKRKIDGGSLCSVS